MQVLIVLALVAIATNGFTQGNLAADAHVVLHLVVGIIVGILICSNLLAFKRRHLGGWTGLLELVLPALGELLVLPTSSFCVAHFDCDEGSGGAKLCWGVGIAGIIGYLTACWLFLNVLLAAITFKACNDAVIEGDARNRSAANRIVVGEEAVAMASP